MHKIWQGPDQVLHNRNLRQEGAAMTTSTSCPAREQMKLRQQMVHQAREETTPLLGRMEQLQNANLHLLRGLLKIADEKSQTTYLDQWLRKISSSILVAIYMLTMQPRLTIYLKSHHQAFVISLTQVRL